VHLSQQRPQPWLLHPRLRGHPRVLRFQRPQQSLQHRLRQLLLQRPPLHLWRVLLQPRRQRLRQSQPLHVRSSKRRPSPRKYRQPQQPRSSRRRSQQLQRHPRRRNQWLHAPRSRQRLRPCAAMHRVRIRGPAGKVGTDRVGGMADVPTNAAQTGSLITSPSSVNRMLVQVLRTAAKAQVRVTALTLAPPRREGSASRWVVVTKRVRTNKVLMADLSSTGTTGRANSNVIHVIRRVRHRRSSRSVVNPSTHSNRFVVNPSTRNSLSMRSRDPR